MGNKNAITETDFSDLKLVSRGKVRNVYGISGINDALLMVATDRISAYDVIMNQPIFGKGRILTNLSLFWLDMLSDIVKNHLVTANVEEYPPACQPYAKQLAGRSMYVLKATPLPLEFIVRGYISGSFWSAYKKSPDGMVCGFQLPPGMLESEKFPEPLLTPSTKAVAGKHDENISMEEMERMIGKSLTQQITEICLALYAKAAAYALSRGIIIADTKFEIGIWNGRPMLIDEVLTPDSSRFWPLDKYKPGQGQPSFDKQFLRDYLSSLDWDKQPPAPELPFDVINKTQLCYEEAERRIIGK